MPVLPVQEKLKQESQELDASQGTVRLCILKKKKDDFKLST